MTIESHLRKEEIDELKAAGLTNFTLDRLPAEIADKLGVQTFAAYTRAQNKERKPKVKEEKIYTEINPKNLPKHEESKQEITPVKIELPEITNIELKGQIEKCFELTLSADKQTKHEAIELITRGIMEIFKSETKIKPLHRNTFLHNLLIEKFVGEQKKSMTRTQIIGLISNEINVGYTTARNLLAGYVESNPEMWKWHKTRNSKGHVIEVLIPV